MARKTSKPGPAPVAAVPAQPDVTRARRNRLVKELVGRGTGATIIDCHKALVDANDDIDVALVLIAEAQSHATAREALATLRSYQLREKGVKAMDADDAVKVLNGYIRTFEESVKGKRKR